VYWNIKTSSSILTGCAEAPTNRFESWAARNLVRFQIVAANLDPEVLQWPGGGLIASLLWLCMMARSLWSVGTVARLHLRGAQAGSLRSAHQSGWQARQNLLISSYPIICASLVMRSPVLPGSTAMTILAGPGKIEPAESRCLKSECRPHLEEFKDIFQTPWKFTLKSDPKGVAVARRPRTSRPHKAARRLAALASRPDIRWKS
jgi:hypothetical protein